MYVHRKCARRTYAKKRMTDTSSSAFLILGYFDRDNLGDDIFLEVWKYLVETRAPRGAKALYASLEDSPEEIASSWAETHAGLPTAIIIAGGDVLTEYFSIKIRNVSLALEKKLEQEAFANQRLSNVEDTKICNVPIYGISVAAPFESAVHLGFCDFYSQLLVRPSANISYLQGRMGRYAVTQAQDLSCYLLQMYSSNSCEKVQYDKTRSKMVVCLAAQICGSGLNVYISNVKNIAEGIVDACKKCKIDEVVFVPFDTSGTDSDDFHLNSDLIREIAELDPELVTTMLFDALEHNVKSVYGMFANGEFDVALCGRYHSHMMAILSHTPLASICVTQKVNSLLQEIDEFASMPCTYEPMIDESGVPYSYDKDSVSSAIQFAKQNSPKIRGFFKNYCNMVRSSGIAVLDRVVRNVFHSPRVRAGVTDVTKVVSVSERADECMKCLLSYLSKEYQLADTRFDEFRRRELSLKDILPPEADTEEVRSFLASMVCTHLTYEMFPAYHYGLAEKILHTPYLLDDIEYIIHDQNVTIGKKRHQSCATVAQDIIKETCKSFHCPGIDRASIWGIHRAGWEYVLRHLWYANSPVQDDTLPIFDDYVDSTFNWMSDCLSALGAIPYRRPWFGCIHHTGTKEAGPNNLENVFANPLFIKSLRKCSYLIAMSTSLADDIRRRLQKCGMSHVQVYELVHPSETPKNLFNWNEFVNNDDKMLVQIGCWYRDPYMLYTLDIPRKNWIRKAALRGKRMHNNFPPSELKINATSEDPPINIGVSFYSNSPDNCPPVAYHFSKSARRTDGDVMMCRPDGVKNSFVYNMMSKLLQDFRSVSVIEHLDNDKYDELLTRNIVFLHMIDAGAINTLVECVLRNTPIIINRLPAVEQVLGSDYPLFYENSTSASLLACSPDKIRKAHEHIAKLDKSRYEMRFFATTFFKFIKDEIRMI